MCIKLFYKLTNADTILLVRLPDAIAYGSRATAQHSERIDTNASTPPTTTTSASAQGSSQCTYHFSLAIFFLFLVSFRFVSCLSTRRSLRRSLSVIYLYGIGGDAPLLLPVVVRSFSALAQRLEQRLVSFQSSFGSLS